VGTAHTTAAAAMSTYRRSATAGGTYFFTVVAYKRQPFLCDPDVREALRQAIHHARENHPFAIDAWVLLPDHLHAIWTLPPDDADFGKRWGLIKSQVSKARGERLHDPGQMTPSKIKHRESTLWQRRFWEHQIRDEADFAHHMNYVHFNPVKHGLVKRAHYWPHSTFHRYVKQGRYPQDWGQSLDIPHQNFGE
jgi:putative transposase